MSDVTLTNVGKVYEGGVRAVEAVNLSIADGEFCVLVGPSGCRPRVEADIPFACRGAASR
jgi:ABC-type sugar transport system ATPase subunit